MNRNLENAIIELGKADALLESIDLLYMDLQFMPEEKTRAKRWAYSFYCLMDAVRNASEHLDEYLAECRIVDVIQEARRAKDIEP